jgi:hypothetical protein
VREQDAVDQRRAGLADLLGVMRERGGGDLRVAAQGMRGVGIDRGVVSDGGGQSGSGRGCRRVRTDGRGGEEVELLGEG